ncbi:class I SAM-dependent methyltransferase [Bacteroidales bacterium]
MSLISFIKRLIPRNIGYIARKLKLFLRGYIYRGDIYSCPICEHEYRKFFDGGFDTEGNTRYQIIGSGRRKHIICPGCASTDRERLIMLCLTNKALKLWPAESILHIAPEPALGSQIKKWQKQNGGLYIGGTKYHEGFYYGDDIQLIDLLHLKFSDNQFDLLICNHVLEHIEDDLRAMSELRRVLRPGGKAILQVPWSPILETTYEDLSIVDEKEREKHFGQFDHVRVYGKDYTARLKQAGFLIEVLDEKALSLDKTQYIRYGLNPLETVFIASK